MKVVCAECQALNGKLTTEVKEPHQHLKLINSENWSRLSTGWAKGSLRHYQCEVCGSKMVGDFDTKDTYAKWELA